MREELFVHGHRLFLRRDGLYEDLRGVKFDFRNGQLYQERSPGVWTLLREAPRFEKETPSRPAQSSSLREF